MYRYQIAGNLVHLVLDAPDSFMKATYVITKDTRNNIISESDTAWNYNSFLGEYDFAHLDHLTMSFDNHPNPFYNIYPKRLSSMNYESASADAFEYFSNTIPQPNNLLDEISPVYNPPVPVYHKHYTYLYNGNGYPASVTIQDFYIGETRKGVYVY